MPVARRAILIVEDFLHSVPNPVIAKPIDVKALRRLIRERTAACAGDRALRTGSR